MKKAKRVLALLLCLVLILSAVGCSAKKDDGKKSSDSEVVTVVDNNGNTVTVKKDIQRIVVCDIYPIPSVLAVFFDSASKIVGMAQPSMAAAKNSLLSELYPEILNAETGFIDGTTVNMEALAALNPDVVFYSSGNKELGKQLTDAGYAAIAISANKWQYNAIETLNNWIDLLSQLFPENNKSEKVRTYSESVYNMVQERVSSIPDAEKAQHYLGLAARQDHAAAQYALGKLFLSDDPEIQNPTQGFYWLERAAESGNDYAAYQLGKEYLSGKNAPKESERAAEYVRMAAEQGNPYAQYLLGKLCLSGDGVPQDRDAAYDWFQKAQAQGHDYAGFFMDRIERPEPPNVLLSATRLLYHMGKIFQGSAPAPQSCGIQIDRKRLAKLRRMRIAAGHKADDHEQEQTNSTMSMGW